MRADFWCFIWSHARLPLLGLWVWLWQADVTLSDTFRHCIAMPWRICEILHYISLWIVLGLCQCFLVLEAHAILQNIRSTRCLKGCDFRNGFIMNDKVTHKLCSRLVGERAKKHMTMFATQGHARDTPKHTKALSNICGSRAPRAWSCKMLHMVHYSDLVAL